MKMPRAWIEAGVSKPEAKQQVTAKFELGEGIIEGRCPVTGNQMERMIANGHEVWCNFQERVVLPVKD